MSCHFQRSRGPRRSPWSLWRWDRGFESHLRHWRLSSSVLCSPVGVEALHRTHTPSKESWQTSKLIKNIGSKSELEQVKRSNPFYRTKGRTITKKKGPFAEWSKLLSVVRYYSVSYQPRLQRDVTKDGRRDIWWYRWKNWKNVFYPTLLPIKEILNHRGWTKYFVTR